MITASQAAEELAVAERERKEIAPLTDAHPDFDVETAYEAQRLGIAARVGRGAVVVGRKLGLTSRNKQQAMGVSAPLHGIVTDDMIAPYGEPLDFAALSDIGWQVGPGIVVTPASGPPAFVGNQVVVATTKAGGAVTFSVALTSVPTEPVVIALGSSNLAAPFVKGSLNDLADVTKDQMISTINAL